MKNRNFSTFFVSLVIVATPFLCVYAETIYFKDGRVRETTISYHDREETCETISEGIENCMSNDKIEKIEPPNSLREFTDNQYNFFIRGPEEYMMLRSDSPYHRSLTEWSKGQLVRFYKYPYRRYFEHSEEYDLTPGLLNPALAVVITPPAGTKTALAYGKDHLRLMEKMDLIRDLVVVSEKDSIPINGNEWVGILVDYEMAGLRVRVSDFYLLKHGLIYWLSVIDKVENFDRNWPEFWQAVQSCVVN